MEKYKIKFKKSVAKDLRKISNQDVQRTLEKINLIAKNPRMEGCVKLSGNELYRVRQGAYRIIYEVRDGELIVLVIKVAHRSRVYKSK